jgi:protein-tyrosine phosphatase
MDWIDDTVAVGNWFDGFYANRRRREGIELTIDARVLFTKRRIPHRRAPRVDCLVKARDEILELLPLGPKVLIYCNRGKDRSVFVAMMYVMKRYDMGCQEAFGLVRSKRSQAAFHGEWASMLGSDLH